MFSINAPPAALLGLLWGGSELFLTLARRSKSNAVSKDRNSLSLIWVATLSGVALAIYAAYHWSFARLPRPNLVVVGACVCVLGLALRWYAILHLGRFFTTNVAIASDHRVIDSGPYRFVRHPAYTGSLIAVLGFGLSFQNWASLLLVFIPCCAATLWRIRIEEHALTEGLGEAYRAYAGRTRRLIPLLY
jgi:protein-S-isoprenylcysteine O-methyltransferase